MVQMAVAAVPQFQQGGLVWEHLVQFGQRRRLLELAVCFIGDVQKGDLGGNDPVVLQLPVAELGGVRGRLLPQYIRRVRIAHNGGFVLRKNYRHLMTIILFGFVNNGWRTSRKIR